MLFILTCVVTLSGPTSPKQSLHWYLTAADTAGLSDLWNVVDPMSVRSQAKNFQDTACNNIQDVLEAVAEE